MLFLNFLYGEESVGCYEATVALLGYDKSEKPEPEQKGIRASDVYTTVEITFEESILGCRKEITVQHKEICPCSKKENCTDNCTICNNTGKVLNLSYYFGVFTR